MIEQIKKKAGNTTSWSGRFGWNFGSGKYLTLEELKKLNSYNNFDAPHWWDSTHSKHSSMYETFSEAKKEFPNIEIRFGGMIEEKRVTIDTVNILFNKIEEKQKFKEWAELRFFDVLPENTNVSESNVVVDSDRWRDKENDPNLWISSDTCTYKEDDKYGEYIYLWWD